MNRIDRVTAILIQLQSKRIVKAQDMAERFNISLRTVYRDIKTLEEAGVPIIGEAGVGYSIMDGYRLPPVMFTKEEAAAFLTGEKLMEKFTDASTEASYKSAMYKIRAVLRSNEKDMLENMEDHIEVFRRITPFTASPLNNTLQMLLKSIVEKKVLHIEYAAYNADKKTDRDIEPVGIFYTDGYWHSIAFCRLRNDYRDFRTDRILGMRHTDIAFSKQHPSLKDYLGQMTMEQELQTIVINVDLESARYLSVQKFYYGFVKEEKIDDCMQMTFLSPLNDLFERWFISFADRAEIVSPDSLRHKLKAMVKKISQKNEW